MRGSWVSLGLVRRVVAWCRWFNEWMYWLGQPRARSWRTLKAGQRSTELIKEMGCPSQGLFTQQMMQCSLTPQLNWCPRICTLPTVLPQWNRLWMVCLLPRCMYVCMCVKMSPFRVVLTTFKGTVQWHELHDVVQPSPLIQVFFVISNTNFVPIKQQFPAPHCLQSLVTCDLPSVSIYLTALAALCKWNHTIFVLLFLANFT